jgi:ABC-2 type transport system permease protein
VIFVPLVVVLAIASPWHALVTAGGVVIAASSATAIQLWFRTQSKRSQFRRRQVSSRVATFAEAFSSIGWAATAAMTAITPVLAIVPAVLTVSLVGGVRFLSPRKQA